MKRDKRISIQIEKIAKIIHHEKIKYLFWGVVTTIVFAFWVNKYFVFSAQQSHSILVQLINFLVGRFIVALLDFGLTYVMIDCYPQFLIRLLMFTKIHYQTWPFHILIGNSIQLNAFLSVLVIQILLIVINYVISKYIVFS